MASTKNPASITVSVNGERHAVAEGMSLQSLLESLEEPHVVAIVELNGRFVHPHAWRKTVLKDGDAIEVILPAFGG